jgi:hypothetical protein
VRGRNRIVAGIAAGLALTLVGAASADKEQIHLTAAGQAAARAAVLTKADFGTATGWTGGHQKPDLSSTPPCANWDPKQSDLVVIGASRTVYKHPGIEFDSETRVLQTPQMVALDWQRTVLAPQLLPCLRSAVGKSAGASTRVLSVTRIAFPKLSTRTGGIRIVVEVKSGGSTARVFVDTLLVGRGGYELSLTTTAPLAAQASVKAAEVRLMRTLVSRARG